MKIPVGRASCCNKYLIFGKFSISINFLFSPKIRDADSKSASIQSWQSHFCSQPAGHPWMVSGKPLPMSPFLHWQNWGDFLLLLCSRGLSKAGFIGLSHHYFVSRAGFAFTDTVSTTHTLELLQLPSSKSTTYSVKQSANLVSMETKLNQLPQQQKYFSCTKFKETIFAGSSMLFRSSIMVVKHNFHRRLVFSYLIFTYAITYSTSFDVFACSFYPWKN